MFYLALEVGDFHQYGKKRSKLRGLIRHKGCGNYHLECNVAAYTPL